MPQRERSRQAESVGLASCYMAISFRIRKILLRPSEGCAVSFGRVSGSRPILFIMSLYVYVVGGSVRCTCAIAVARFPELRCESVNWVSIAGSANSPAGAGSLAV